MSKAKYKVYCICDNCNKGVEVRDTGYKPKDWYDIVVSHYSSEAMNSDSYWKVFLCNECLVVGNKVKEAKVNLTNLFSWLGGYLKKR